MLCSIDQGLTPYLPCAKTGTVGAATPRTWTTGAGELVAVPLTVHSAPAASIAMERAALPAMKPVGTVLDDGLNPLPSEVRRNVPGFPPVVPMEGSNSTIVPAA